MRMMLPLVLAAALSLDGFGPQAGDRSVVAGVVIDGDSGRPIERATVSLRARGQRAASVVTSNGAFSFSPVSAGDYDLSASRSGYVGGGYGQRTARSRSFKLTVGSNNQTPPITLRLWKTGGIAGRVLDESAEPVAKAELTVLRPSGDAGEYEIVRLPKFVTNDLGEYRIHGLPPGAYFVAVANPLSQAGELYPRADREPFEAQYYPMSSRISAASPVEVTGSQVVTGIDFRLRKSNAYAVSGRIVSDDPSRFWTVELRPVGPEFTTLDSLRLQVAPDGTFSFPSVTEGAYSLRALSFSKGGNAITLNGVRMIMFSPGESEVRPVPLDPTLWAEATVSITKDVADLVLQPRRGSKLRGRAAFVDAPVPEARELLASSIDLLAHDGTALQGLPTARFESDGRFETAGLPPGRYSLLVSAGFRGWMLADVTSAATTHDGSLAVGTSDVDGVVVTFVRTPAILSGRVADEPGRSAPSAGVFVFPADERFWSSRSNVPARFLETAADQSGRFVIPELPLGEYRVIAFAASARISDNWSQSPQLRKWMALATPVTGEPGARLTINLTAQK